MLWFMSLPVSNRLHFMPFFVQLQCVVCWLRVNLILLTQVTVMFVIQFPSSDLILNKKSVVQYCISPWFDTNTKNVHMSDHKNEGAVIDGNKLCVYCQHGLLSADCRLADCLSKMLCWLSHYSIDIGQCPT